MSMTMSNTDRSTVEVITGIERRRRWTREEKLALIHQSMEPGQSVSLVARQAGVAASQLFEWRRLYREGSLIAVGANESVVAASELQEAMKRIKLLERALGRKTLENEILKEAVEYAREKKWIARSPVLPQDDR